MVSSTIWDHTPRKNYYIFVKFIWFLFTESNKWPLYAFKINEVILGSLRNSTCFSKQRKKFIVRVYTYRLNCKAAPSFPKQKFLRQKKITLQSGIQYVVFSWCFRVIIVIINYYTEANCFFTFQLKQNNWKQRAGLELYQLSKREK